MHKKTYIFLRCFLYVFDFACYFKSFFSPPPPNRHFKIYPNRQFVTTFSLFLTFFCHTKEFTPQSPEHPSRRVEESMTTNQLIFFHLNSSAINCLRMTIFEGFQSDERRQPPLLHPSQGKADSVRRQSEKQSGQNSSVHKQYINFDRSAVFRSRCQR